ncbi:macrophage migration inhibitory factor homolog [Cajanus cajan]|nr:macrophage migration inhibitory factor homolog [Cajanus cajan]
MNSGHNNIRNSVNTTVREREREIAYPEALTPKPLTHSVVYSKATMPTLNLFTNLPVDTVVASDILRDATKAVAKIIGKPESYVMILLNGGVPIAFAGTEEPAAYGELISIGGLGPSVNGKLSSTIAEILQTKLYIDSSRFYIKFYDVQRSFFGFNGSTF